MNDVGEMRKKYTGKTMLFLDGSHLGALAIQRAKEWGIRTVVANYYPQKENPGKQICDVAVDIDYNNIPEMLKLIEREHIDGIMAGWTDSILPVYARICERAGMPSYGTEEQFDLFTQKHKYKRLLEQYDIPVVDEYQLDDRFDPQELVRIEYPVLTKPSDGSGSRGIKVCRNEAELKEGYRYAKEHSVSGDVIIEKYMQGDEIVALWYVQDGEAHLTALGNWHKKQYYDGLNAMGIGYTFPSSYLNIYEKTIG